VTTDGSRDPLYEDDETLLTAGVHGYVLLEGNDNPRYSTLHGPLKEDEMLKLIDKLRIPNRKRFAKAIREHANEFPHYRSKVKVAKARREEPKEDKQEQNSKRSGCGCFFWLIIIIGILYFMGSNQNEFEDSTIVTPPQEAVTPDIVGP
jgi:hypothetical protein